MRDGLPHSKQSGSPMDLSIPFRYYLIISIVFHDCLTSQPHCYLPSEKVCFESRVMKGFFLKMDSEIALAMAKLLGSNYIARSTTFPST